MQWVFLVLPFLGVLAAEITVDLRNPRYKNGVVFTDEGGVVKAKDIRIQAQTIAYTHKKGGEHRIEAAGDLMMQYRGRVFIGESLSYDFLTGSGTILRGTTFDHLWFISGEQIALHRDGSYVVDNAAITISENKGSNWDVHASSVDGFKTDLFHAENVVFRLGKLPVFWLPSIKLNLKKSDQDPVFHYFLDWDKGQGPRAGMRYQIYSWYGFSLFGRVEYRWKTGWGGAIESEYDPPNSQTRFVTRSYVGTDRLETAPNKQFRFRLEGAHQWRGQDGRTSTALTWDKYSDVRMPSDFKDEDFEIGTAKQTLFFLHHQSPFAISNFKVRPRVNTFESIKQDLPTAYLHILPVELGPSGVLSSLFLKGSYVDFAYSDQLATSPMQPPIDYRSGRFEGRERLYRPFFAGPVTITPQIGFSGILYTNSPTHRVRALSTINYGIDLTAQAKRTYANNTHLLKPYIGFSSFTQPTISVRDHYIFSIADGYHEIHQLQAGIRNLLLENGASTPWCTAELMANGFFSPSALRPFVPYLNLWLEWKLPSVYLSLQNIWNFRNQVLDRCNARCKWTVNENIAMSLEARYRSRFDWRKADLENFVVDVTRSEEELLSSPLSDRRITFLTNVFIRFSPFWECQFCSHHGFFRLTENPYNEFEFDLFTWLASSLKLRLSYRHTDKDDRVSGHLYLIKK